MERGGTGLLELGSASPRPASPVQIVPIQPAQVEPPSPGRYKAVAGLLVGLVFGAAGYYLIRSRRNGRGQRSVSPRPESIASADADTDSYAR